MMASDTAVPDATVTEDTQSHSPPPGSLSHSGASVTATSRFDSDIQVDPESPHSKRRKTNHVDGAADGDHDDDHRGSRVPRGTAAIKQEYLLDTLAAPDVEATNVPDDDAAEAAPHTNGDHAQGTDKKKNRGQNKARHFGRWGEEVQLCATRMHSDEFSPRQCKFGDKCRFEHDLRSYLRAKRGDLDTFSGVCPLWNVQGVCPAGWKCRFLKSHSKEVDREDGRKELILVEDAARKQRAEEQGLTGEEVGVVNIVKTEAKFDLARKRFKTPRADAYNGYLNKLSGSETRGHKNDDGVQENRAAYIEPPFLPSEKRRIYYGPETPVLAPLTTQGNLPFRRLCVSLGAELTWSEMAMGLNLIQGEKSEWALPKAHTDEVTPPRIAADSASAQRAVALGYDSAKDSRFGIQIAGNKPWVVLKTTEVLTALVPHLRAIDLNCGCPIDLVCRQGAGSALLDSPSKLEKIVRGMTAVSGEVPITIKIRTGTRDKEPTADRLIERMTLGGHEARVAGIGGPGTAAITLHGRSKQQRYTRLANWSYIAECSALIARLNKQAAEIADTAADVDPRSLPNGGRIYFVGNGDCFSHVDYHDHISNANLDSVMVGRGALIKPWIFEEIEAGQYLDKSASERLGYVEKFARFGLEAWGSDELGVGTTRRFLLEWLSFSCRYVPLGILETLPPRINERPPPFKGRNELETLLSSGNYKDWIKISEMFLGPAPASFQFIPKHKSNAYTEVEG